MKRLHVHAGVQNLEQSIGFCSTLFGAEPTLVKADYAKWIWTIHVSTSPSPRVVMPRKASSTSGIQVEDRDELDEVYDRLKAADGAVLEEGRTTCCYAKSGKSWISDPDGVVWEAFFTSGEATVYGDSPPFDTLRDERTDDACCAPAMPAVQSGKVACRG